MKFSKDELSSLLDSVIAVVNEKIRANKKFSSIVSDDKKRYMLKLYFTKFSLSLIGVIKSEPIDIFEKIIDFLSSYSLNEEDIKWLFYKYFEFLYNWIYEHDEKLAEKTEERIKNFESLVEENIGIKLELIDEDSGVIVFRSDDIKGINREHFVDNKKISAKEYMEDNFMNDSEVKADILETIQRFEDIDNFTISISKDYIDGIIGVLAEFMVIFEHGNEFSDIRESLRIFSDQIYNYDIDKLTDKQKILLKEFISNVMEDIVEWNRKVIIEQSAVDIHYLDASIRANLTQFEIVLDSIEDLD